MTGPLLSVVLIVKDEAESLEGCLASFWDACSECVVVDTGSRDNSLEVAERFAESTGEPDKLVTGTYAWRDRFDEARNYADSLASGEWVTYLDADEIMHGAEWLHRILSVPSAAELDALAVSVFSPAVCRAVRDGDQNVIAPRTTRVRRAGTTRFVGRVHEMPEPITGKLRATAMVNPRHCRVEQLRDSGRPESMSRNLRISEQWVRDQPDDARAVAMHAFCLYTFHAFRGEPDGLVRAAGLAERGQRMTPRWHTAYMLPALVAHMQGRYADAARIAREALDPNVRLLDQHGDRVGLAVFVQNCEQRAAQTAPRQTSRLWLPPAAREAVAA